MQGHANLPSRGTDEEKGRLLGDRGACRRKRESGDPDETRQSLQFLTTSPVSRLIVNVYEWFRYE